MERTRKEIQPILGQVYATINALAACERSGIDPQTLLDSHAGGESDKYSGTHTQWNKGERAKSAYIFCLKKTLCLQTYLQIQLCGL